MHVPGERTVRLVAYALAALAALEVALALLLAQDGPGLGRWADDNLASGAITAVAMSACGAVVVRDQARNLHAWLFLVEAHLLWRRPRRSDDLAEVRPMRLFHWSNMYLSLLFVAVALDPLLKR